MPSHDSLIGKTIDRYEVQREIGRGGMGVVYLARERGTGQVVALKVLATQFLRDPAYIKRFKREGQTAAGLKHPNIVEIHEVGEYRGVHFMAMEYVDGRTLGDVIAREGRLGIQEVLRIIRDVGEALKVAHEHGAVHRDIKPTNIMIKPSGAVKLMDFGLVKVRDARTQLTAHGVKLGTPAYMSPEQVKGEPLDGRTDIYSLGVMLYEMLTGERPFQADTHIALMYQILHEPFPELDKESARGSPLLVRIVADMTAKKLDERYPSANTLCGHLDAVLRELEGGQEEPIGEAASRMPYTGPTYSKQPTREWGRRMGAVVVLLVVLVAGALATRAVLSRDSVDKEAEPLTDEILLIADADTSDSDSEEALLSPEMVWIEPGTFMMGTLPRDDGAFKSGETQHQVTLTKGFWLGKYEVTQAEWETVMGNNRSHYKGPRNPVESVKWNDVQAFLRRLNARGDGKFRLPTEAEWEYACRAGSTTASHFGDIPPLLGEYGWHRDNSENTTHPVGEKKPNVWGLHDMHGNVEEWCADWFRPFSAKAVSDPKGPRNGEKRIIRGGHCLNQPQACSSGTRRMWEPIYGRNVLGFRLARDE